MVYVIGLITKLPTLMRHQSRITYFLKFSPIKKIGGMYTGENTRQDWTRSAVGYPPIGPPQTYDQHPLYPPENVPPMSDLIPPPTCQRKNTDKPVSVDIDKLACGNNLSEYGSDYFDIFRFPNWNVLLESENNWPNFQITINYPTKPGRSKVLKLAMQQLIGTGGYGTVSKYTDSYTGVSYAVKSTESCWEAEVSRQLETGNCQTIPCRLLYTNRHGLCFFLMPMMSGDLNSLKRKLKTTLPKDYPRYCRTVLTLCEIVRQQLICIHAKVDCAYLDLKLANILYMCDNGKFTLHIGDLGSIYLPKPNTSKYHNLPQVCTTVSTFPPPEFKWEAFKEYSTKENIYPLLAWQLGTLFFQFSPNQTECRFTDTMNRKCDWPILHANHLKESHHQNSHMVIEKWCYESAEKEVGMLFGEKISKLLCVKSEERPDITHMNFLDQVSERDELYLGRDSDSNKIPRCGIS